MRSTRQFVAVQRSRSLGRGLRLAALTAVASLAIPAAVLPAAAASPPAKAQYVRLNKQVPPTVSDSTARFVAHVPGSFKMSVNFGLPIRNLKALNSLILQEAKSHQYLSRAELYQDFAPTKAQYSALASWATSQGLKISYRADDRLNLGVKAPASAVEAALQVQENIYRAGPKGQEFYANANGARVPASLGIQSISGLNNTGRFVTSIQMANQATAAARKGMRAAAKAAGPQAKTVRSGGYIAGDIRSDYDISGHANDDGTGETLGYTLWGAALNQKSLTDYALATGDPSVINDTTNGTTTGYTNGTCVGTVASGPNAGTPCNQVSEPADTILWILENGNTNTNYGGDTETGLDVDISHGMAPHAGMKYYIGDCSTAPATAGLTSGDSCNGSDTGIEEAISDAATDPTLHTVSDSWAYGGDPEYGTNDPFYQNAQNSLAIAAAAGTTFYFSTGDSGSYESGFPSDSQYVVAVGGTTVFSTINPAQFSTETTWALGGTWCSNVVPRPAWQTGPGVAANASCPGRAIPDVSADADTTSDVLYYAPSNTAITVTGASYASGTAMLTFPSRAVPTVGLTVAVLGMNPTGYNGQYVITASSATSLSYALASDPGPFVSGGTANLQSDSHGGVGGTSVAAPLVNGMEAATEDFIAHQTYPGATPAIGFEAPVIYALGNSANYDSYFFDLRCGNNADPASGPDGESALQGWDQATGFGRPDWYNFSVGYAQYLGATGLSTPSSVNPNYNWNCVQTPGNQSIRGISCPTTGTCYGAGATNSPWYKTYLPSGVLGSGVDILKTTNGGTNWFAQSTDMIGVACTSASNCIEVGDGGRIRVTSNGGSTWSYVSSGYTKALTSVQCPSSTICYAAGDRGTVLKSDTDGGNSWTTLSTSWGNPLYGLSCPSTTSCFAVDNYGYVIQTSDGGATWQDDQTPATTPDTNVPGSGGPNPYAGLFGITCTSTTTCIAVGGYQPSGNAPIEVTTNGGTTWTADSASGTTNKLYGVACEPSTTTCFAVGASGTIVQSTDMTTWTTATSGTTSDLNSITCVSTTECFATGQSGQVDVFNGTSWTPSTSGSNFLAGITCADSNNCYIVGQQGVTYNTTSASTTPSWALQAGGSTANQINAFSCPSAAECVAVGASGTILETLNGGQTWKTQTSGTSVSLAGVSCTSVTTCVVVGAGATGVAAFIGLSNNASNAGGSTWTSETSNTGTGTTSNLNAVNCSGSTCMAADTNGSVDISTNGGTTWTLRSTGNTTALAGIACPSSSSCVAVGSSQGSTTVTGISWASGTATLTFAVRTSALPIGSTIAVNGILPFGYDGTFQVTGSTTTSVSYAVASNPGQTVLPITNASYSGTTATLNFATLVAPTAGLSVTVAGMNPSGFNGSYTVTTGTTSSVSYTLGSNPGPFVSGGTATLPPYGGTITLPAVMATTSNTGTSWSLPNSGSAQSLTSVACATANNCYAGGGLGTIVASANGGSTWAQQGDPLSGPTTALNVTSSTIIGILSVACAPSGACFTGAGSSGNIMMNPGLSDSITYTGPTTATDGTSLTVSATLVDGSSNPISGATLNFALAPAGVDQTCSAVTNGSGVASCTISSVSATPGGRDLRVSFSADGVYASNSIDTTVTVSAGAGDTLTYNSPSSATDGTSVTFSATLTDSNTTAGISGDTLYFALAPGSVDQTCSGVTDGTGTATCTINDVTALPGSRTVAVTFNGDGTYPSNQVLPSITVNPGAADTLTYNSPSSATDGSSLTFSATLTDSNTTAGISGETVNFALAPGSVDQTCSGVTDGTGTATCTINDVTAAAGSRTVAVTFNGDGTYPSNQLLTSMTVNAGLSDTITYTGPTSISDGAGVTVSATLTDTNTTAAITGDTLTFQIAPALGGESCTAVTDGTGTATCTIPYVDVTTGTRNMRVSFAGDGTYPANQSDNPVTVS
jgi:photosystem II stability/assembly factor-like uncharacterized protein